MPLIEAGTDQTSPAPRKRGPNYKNLWPLALGEYQPLLQHTGCYLRADRMRTSAMSTILFPL